DRGPPETKPRTSFRPDPVIGDARLVVKSPRVHRRRWIGTAPGRAAPVLAGSARPGPVRTTRRETSAEADPVAGRGLRVRRTRGRGDDRPEGLDRAAAHLGQVDRPLLDDLPLSLAAPFGARVLVEDVEDRSGPALPHPGKDGGVMREGEG